jgi:DNA-binding NarL/FixJ family response regulator
MGTAVIRVVIVDTHPMFVDGFRSAVATAQDMTVVASPSTLDAARDALQGTPEIVVCDIQLPRGTGFQLLAEARRQPHPPAFAMMSSSDSPHYAHASLRLGAAGFLLKTSPTTRILDSLRRIARGSNAYDVDPTGAPQTLGCP